MILVSFFPDDQSYVENKLCVTHGGGIIHIKNERIFKKYYHSLHTFKLITYFSVSIIPVHCLLIVIIHIFLSTSYRSIMLLRTILIMQMLLVALVASSETSYGLCIAGCYAVSFVGKLFGGNKAKNQVNFVGPVVGGAAAGLHGPDECVRVCKPFIGSSYKSNDL